MQAVDPDEQRVIWRAFTCPCPLIGYYACVIRFQASRAAILYASASVG